MRKSSPVSHIVAMASLPRETLCVIRPFDRWTKIVRRGEKLSVSTREELPLHAARNVRVSNE
ncbi:MAG: hypothetical protein H6Q86_817 [candidate division NC10 bacterium]|nr:hypothetical protein [candidate division NC10 bacterium]